MKVFFQEVGMYLLNHIVNHVPWYAFRRSCYRLAGMKVGKDSRILMNVFIQTPSGISIGDNSIINEYCYLDGRGGLSIGNNVSISMYSKVLTGTHDCHSDTFCYKSEPVILEDNTWLGISSTVMPGSKLPKGAVLAAGSVAIKKGNYEEKGLYSGVPAKLIGYRKTECNYVQSAWKPRFR